jgi:hypothetical protein
MSLWGPGAECYDLNMKCPPQDLVLNAWSLAGGSSLEGVKTAGGGA